jgi:hypothetical protein
VQLGVDERDVEAAGVEDAGELRVRGDMAVRRERHEHHVRLPRRVHRCKYLRRS